MKGVLKLDKTRLRLLGRPGTVVAAVADVRDTPEYVADVVAHPASIQHLQTSAGAADVSRRQQTLADVSGT